MKERPIPFSAPMVRALLAGTKTQTRRVVKPQPEWTEPATVWQHGDGHSGLGWYAHNGEYPEEGALHYRCPYGQRGDRLWVREAWAKTQPIQLPWPQTMVVYREGDNRTDYGGPWKPSIHMPRAFSRITLEVTGVRVERLQDISADDARAEGCPDKPVKDAEQASVDMLAKLWFHDLWAQINGQGSWDANPWVWVVDFKRVEAAHG